LRLQAQFSVAMASSNVEQTIRAKLGADLKVLREGAGSAPLKSLDDDKVPVPSTLMNEFISLCSELVPRDPSNSHLFSAALGPQGSEAAGNK